jgi:polyphosphate kinase
MSDQAAPVNNSSSAANDASAEPADAHLREPEGGWDLNAPELFLNRELTWLEFNRRVLAQAQDERVPLLERVKFIAIVSSNLDEFFMKRIGGLKQQVGAGMSLPTVDGRTPQQQLDECNQVVRELESQKRTILPDLQVKLL